MSSYTPKAILAVFQDMLRKTPFDKITVSAIVARCEISSNTFYYHFHDIYDLLDAWLQLVLKKYITDPMKTLTWQQALKNLLRDMQRNPDLVYHLFNSLSRERLERYIFTSTDTTFYQMVCKVTEGVPVPEDILREVTLYNSYAFLGFFLRFLWNGMKDDADEGVDRLSRDFEGSLQWVITAYKK